MIFGSCCCCLVGFCAINIEKRKKAIEEEIEDQEEKSKDIKPFCVKKVNPCQRKQQKSTAFLVRIIGLRTKKEGIFFRFWSKLVFRVGQMTNCTISNIKFKVAHCCVVVYALSFSRNWLKVFFSSCKGCWALWNQLMIQQK